MRPILTGALALTMAVVWNLSAGSPSHRRQRDSMTKLFQAGNYKDAYEGLRKLALDKANDPLEVGKDLDLGVASLVKLGRIDEADDFREAVAAVHAKNLRLLETAALGYQNTEHYGFIVAGKFYRGNKRGGDDDDKQSLGEAIFFLQETNHWKGFYSLRVDHLIGGTPAGQRMGLGQDVTSRSTRFHSL